MNNTDELINKAKELGLLSRDFYKQYLSNNHTFEDVIAALKKVGYYARFFRVALIRKLMGEPEYFYKLTFQGKTIVENYSNDLDYLRFDAIREALNHYEKQLKTKPK